MHCKANDCPTSHPSGNQVDDLPLAFNNTDAEQTHAELAEDVWDIVPRKLMVFQFFRRDIAKVLYTSFNPI